MDGAESFAGGDGVANFFVNHDSHGRINGIFLPGASAAQKHAGGANLLTHDGGNVP